MDSAHTAYRADRQDRPGKSRAYKINRPTNMLREAKHIEQTEHTRESEHTADRADRLGGGRA